SDLGFGAVVEDADDRGQLEPLVESAQLERSSLHALELEAGEELGGVRLYRNFDGLGPRIRNGDPDILAVRLGERKDNPARRNRDQVRMRGAEADSRSGADERGLAPKLEVDRGSDAGGLEQIRKDDLVGLHR